MAEFLDTPFGFVLLTFGQTLALLVPLLMSVAYLTLAERKILAAMQLRKGPNVTGPFGLAQPFADALKMMMKETVIPTGANRILFILAPMLTFSLAMIAWAVIPVNDGWAIAGFETPGQESEVDSFHYVGGAWTYAGGGSADYCADIPDSVQKYFDSHGPRGCDSTGL